MATATESKLTATTHKRKLEGVTRRIIPRGEVREQLLQLALQTQKDKKDLVSAKKRIAAEYKKNIDEAEAELDRIFDDLKWGKSATVDIEIVIDSKTEIVREYLVPSGELIDERPMRESERQMSLDEVFDAAAEFVDPMKAAQGEDTTKPEDEPGEFADEDEEEESDEDESDEEE